MMENEMDNTMDKTMDHAAETAAFDKAADAAPGMQEGSGEDDCRIYTIRRSEERKKDWEGEHLKMRYFSGRARTFAALYRDNDEEGLNDFMRRTYLEPEGEKHLQEGIALVVLNYASKHFRRDACAHAGVAAEDIAMSMFTKIIEKLPAIVSAESPRRYLQKMIRMTFRAAMVDERDLLDPIRSSTSRHRPVINLALSGKKREEMDPEDQALYDRAMKDPMLSTVYVSAWQQRFPVCLSSPVPDGEEEVTYADVIAAPCSDPFDVLCTTDQDIAASEAAAHISDPLRRAVFLACIRGIPAETEHITVKQMLENGRDYCRDVLGLSGRKRMKLLREALCELAETCGYRKLGRRSEESFPA